MAKQGLAFLIEVKSALHMGQAPMGVGEYLFTNQYIPGSALRGALAEVLLAQGLKPGPGSEFNRLFEGPQAVRFEPAYAATKTGRGYPFPLTARKCKARGGFPPPKARTSEWQNYHGVFDTLVSQVVFEEQLIQMRDKGVPLLLIEKPLCPHCWGGVEPASGVYAWVDRYGPPEVTIKVELARHTHTAINRARGAAEDAMLYTVETIEPGALLRGCVWMEEDQILLVRDALRGITRLGRGVTRGKGQIAVEPLDEPPESDTRTRIKELTDLFRAEHSLYAQLHGGSESQDDSYYFTLDLLSPAILGDGVTATLGPSDLGLPAGVELVRRFVAPAIVGGWWRAAGLPYPTALATAAGSVFLYRAPAEVDLDLLSASLDNLGAEGIGQMHERGYGALVPCAPFHLWTAEKEAER